MKRIGFLITEENITIDFCKAIILKASKGKRRRPEVRRILRQINYYAEKLRKIILEETYVPAPYVVDYRRDSGSKKIAGQTYLNFFQINVFII